MSQQKKAMKKAREKAKKEEDQKKKVQEEKDNIAKPGKLKLIKKNFVKEKTIEGLKTDVALAEIDFDFDDCESDGGIDDDDISKSNSKFFTKTPDEETSEINQLLSPLSFGSRDAKMIQKEELWKKTVNQQGSKRILSPENETERSTKQRSDIPIPIHKKKE